MIFINYFLTSFLFCMIAFLGVVHDEDPEFKAKLAAARKGKAKLHLKTSEILQALRSGSSITDIAHDLSVWPTTIYRIAKRNGVITNQTKHKSRCKMCAQEVS